MSLIALLLAVQGASSPAVKFEPPPLVRENAGPIEAVQIGPVYRQPFVCSEHAEGEMDYAGDALGTDCMVMGGFDPRSDGGFGKLYRSDGKANEDWYGWRAGVLAPFDGKVKAVLANEVVNQPGKFGRPPASMILFERADGVVVVYAHVTAVKVKPGDLVSAGQAVASVGNNGMSRSPHVHVGAYRGDLPLQIRWDLRAMGKLQAR
jgi:murein DD-endopeptidase MepM/ murein hydrolase activator NlpD